MKLTGSSCLPAVLTPCRESLYVVATTRAADRIDAGRKALPFLGDAFKSLGESAIVLLIALYFLLFGAEMRRKFNALLPTDLRHRVDLWETDVNRILGG